MNSFNGELKGNSFWNPTVKKYSIYVVLFAAFLDILGLTIMIPLLPFWIKALGSNELAIGIIISIYSLAHLIFSPFWGKLSDKYGRRPVLLIGLFGSSQSFLLLVFTALFFNNIEMIFISRLLAGIFASATLPSAQAFITDSTENGSKERTKYLGLIGAMSGLGFALGPVVGSIFAKLGQIINISSTGYWAPALIATILSFINFLAGTKYLPKMSLITTHKATQEYSEDYRLQKSNSLIKLLLNPFILVAFMIYGILHLIFSILDSTLVIFGTSRIVGFDELNAGLIFMIAGLTMIITQGFLLQIFLRYFTNRMLLLTGMLILAISYFLASFTDSLLYMMILAFPLALGFSLSFPTTLTILTNQTNSQNTGKILGINSSIGALMRVFGPILGTSLFMIQTDYPWLISAASLVLGFFVLIIVLFWTDRLLQSNNEVSSAKN